MSVVVRKALADLRRRPLHTGVIATVTLLSSLAATLALSLLVESDAPYDHAFEQANGPHLVVTFDASKVSAAQLARSAHVAGITEASGPLPATVAEASFAGGAKGGGSLTFGIPVVGRSGPAQTVDRITMQGGSWPVSSAGIVLSASLARGTESGVGDQVTFPDAPGRPTLTVTGIATSIVAGDGAWVLPDEALHLAPTAAPGKKAPVSSWVMEYRVAQPDQPATFQRELSAVSAGLPSGSVVGTDWWLYARTSANLTAAVMVPFLLAFSALGLMAGAFVIANVVAGVAIADRRQLGIMKSIGFTPLQCTAVMAVQVLIPALLGAVVGAVLGSAAAQPFLSDTAAALGLPTYLGATVGIAVGVIAMSVAVALLSASRPAIRSGRMSAVAAIAVGSSPSRERHAGMVSLLARLRLPAGQRLGVADLSARPARTAMTGSALLVGVAVVTFATSLTLSLGMVASSLSRSAAVQVAVDFAPDEPAAAVARLIAAEPGTARYVAEGQGQVTVTGLAAPIHFFGYRGGSEWTGYAMISGRWFSAPGEVVAPSHLIDVTGLRIGQTFTASVAGRTDQLTLVGEVFDQTGDDLLLRGSWNDLAALDPRAGLDTYEVQLTPGVSSRTYAAELDSASPSIDARPTSDFNASTAFLLIETVVTGLALVLAGIAAAGVLNTVALRTRERRREIAVLKAIGMDPAQVVRMVLSGVGATGLAAGALGVTLGVLMHRAILTSMAEIATNTRVPSSFYGVLGPVQLAGLAMVGVLIGLAGAWLPAAWSAREPPAPALQAE